MLDAGSGDDGGFVDSAIPDARTESDSGNVEDAGTDGSVPEADGSVPQEVKISGIEPVVGSVTGGTPVLIAGSAFVAPIKVRFGSQEASEVTLVSSSALQVITPPGAPGPVDVTVENGDGQSVTVSGGFTYEVPKTCKLVSSTPALAAVDVHVGVAPSFEWNLAIDPSSVGEENVLLRSIGDVQASIAATVTVDGKQVTITPEAPLDFWGVYSVSIQGLTAQGGEECEAVSLAFSTVVPAIVPPFMRPAPIDKTALVGDRLYAVSASLGAMQIYDVSEPTTPTLIGEFRTKSIPTNIHVRDSRAYIVMGVDGVEIVDISNPDQPVSLGVAGTPGTARDVQAVDRDGRNYIIVADGTEGVRILDATNPKNVTNVTRLEPAGPRASDSRAVFVEGDTLAVADGAAGWSLVSIADLANPVVTASGSRVNRQAVDIEIADGRLFVALFPVTVASFDMADIAWTSTSKQVLEFPSGSTSRVQEIRTSGDSLFVAAGIGGVIRVNKNSFTDRVDYETPRWAYSLQSTTDYLIVGEEGGVVILDRNDPDAGVLYRPNDGTGLAQSLVVSGQRAYVATVSAGVQVFNLTAAERPSFINSFVTYAGRELDKGAYGVAMQGTLLAVADGRGGVAFYDTADYDPAADILRQGPTLLGQGPAAGHIDLVTTLAVVDNLVLACNDNNPVLVLDPSAPSADSPHAQLTLSPNPAADRCLAIEVTDELIVISRQLGLTLFQRGDLSAPPTYIELAGGDAVRDTVVRGTHLYALTTRPDLGAAAGNVYNLRVFDFTSPDSPVELWSSPDLGGARALALRGQFLFAALGERGVVVYNVSNPAAPVLLGTIPVPGRAYELVATSETVYVTLYGGGLAAIHTGPLP